jgi:hypothetical protein
MRKILFLLIGTLLLFATPALAATYEVTVNTCDPPNMDTHASRTMGRGILFNVTANGDYTIHVFLCDASSNHNLIAHETRMVSTSDEVMVFGKTTITWNESYFLFVGIEVDGTYTSANTLFISSDGSVIPGAFTGDGVDVGDNFDLGSAKDDDYIGCFLFFEPGFYDSGSTIGPQTPAEWGQAVRDWGEDIGVPYFYFIIAVIIAAVCIAIPFSLAVKYDLDLPNFIYTIFIMVGVSVDWYIGLLDLWMFAMVIIIAVMATVIKYQETIQKLITAPKEVVKLGVRKTITSPASLKQEGLLSKAQAARETARRKAFLRKGHEGLTVTPREQVSEEDWVTTRMKAPVYGETGSRIHYFRKKNGG